MASDPYTRIPVDDSIAERLREDKFAKESWSEYFLRVLDRDFPDVTKGVTTDNEAVLNRLDDLEADLPRKIAGELAQR